MKVSVEEGHISRLASLKTIAEGVAVKQPGDLTFEITKKYVDDIVTRKLRQHVPADTQQRLQETENPHRKFNASHRALVMLKQYQLIDVSEERAVKKVLGAAAMTYVASTLMAFLNLFRMLLIRGRN